MSSPETDREWFLIYCDVDDSHTLVDETKVICDESVREGDEVKFSYPGVKDLLDGVVRAISRDKKKMIKEQDRLNKLSKPRREPSFHADRPRKAALHAKKVLGGAKVVSKEASSGRGVSTKDNSGTVLKEWKHSSQDGKQKPLKTVMQDVSYSDDSDEPLRRKDASSGRGVSMKDNSSTVLKEWKHSSQDGKQKPLKTLMQDVSSDESVEPLRHKDIHVPVSTSENFDYSEEEKDHLEETVSVDLSSSSSESDMELTHEEEELLKKLTKKSRKRDHKDLAQLVSLQKKPKNHYKGNDDGEEKMKRSIEGQDMEWPKDKSFRKAGDKEESKNSEDRVDKNKEKEVEEKSSRYGEKVDKMDIHDQFIKTEFNGNFFRTSEDSPNAVAFPSTNIYETQKQLKDVKRRGHTATATARMLLSFIYTDEAMAACSVSGVARVNRATKEVSQRPALHQEGIDAIIDFVTARASKEGWPCPPDSMIRQCLNNKLCELRAEAKARMERLNQSKRKSE